MALLYRGACVTKEAPVNERKSFLVLGIIALTFGATGMTDIDESSGLVFSLVFTVAALVLLVLYFRAALRRTTPKRITIPLVCVCLFFGGMGLSDIGKDPFGVALGLAVALPLLLEILLRLRSRKFPEPIERKAAPVRYESKPEPQPAARPVKICPNCGAPGRGDICEYCGGPI